MTTAMKLPRLRLDDLLTEKVVKKMLGVSDMWMWRKTNVPSNDDPPFPPQVKMGRKNFRSKSGLEAWLTGEAERGAEALARERAARRKAERLARRGKRATADDLV